jgi:hypothetical protein
MRALELSASNCICHGCLHRNETSPLSFVTYKLSEIVFKVVRSASISQQLLFQEPKIWASGAHDALGLDSEL